MTLQDIVNKYIAAYTGNAVETEPVFIQALREHFTHLIEEEAKGMEIKTSGKGWIDSTNWSGYREAISDYKSRLIEAVKGK